MSKDKFVSTGDIGKILGFYLKSAFIIDCLDILPQHETTTGIFWLRSDIPKIRLAMSNYLFNQEVNCSE